MAQAAIRSLSHSPRQEISPFSASLGNIAEKKYYLMRSQLRRKPKSALIATESQSHTRKQSKVSINVKWGNTCLDQSENCAPVWKWQLLFFFIIFPIKARGTYKNDGFSDNVFLLMQIYTWQTFVWNRSEASGLFGIMRDRTRKND